MPLNEPPITLPPISADQLATLHGVLESDEIALSTRKLAAAVLVELNTALGVDSSALKARYPHLLETEHAE